MQRATRQGGLWHHQFSCQRHGHGKRDELAFHSPLAGREQEGFPLPKPSGSLGSRGSLLSHPLPGQRLPAARWSWQLVTVSSLPWGRNGKADHLPLLKRMRAAAAAGQAAPCCSQPLTRAPFSAIQPGRFKLNYMKAKVYNPKLSKGCILAKAFSIPFAARVSPPSHEQPGTAGSRGHHTISYVIYTLPSGSRVNL